MSLFDRKTTSRERTQEERERARAEREARRAAREGREPAPLNPTVAPPWAAPLDPAGVPGPVCHRARLVGDLALPAVPRRGQRRGRGAHPVQQRRLGGGRRARAPRRDLLELLLRPARAPERTQRRPPSG